MLTQSRPVLEYRVDSLVPNKPGRQEPSQLSRFMSMVPVSAAGGIASNSLVSVLLYFVGVHSTARIDAASAFVGILITFVIITRYLRVFSRQS